MKIRLIMATAALILALVLPPAVTPKPARAADLAWTSTGGEINTSRIHALAYDSVHNLLYAGMSTGIDGSNKNGVWCYDGSTWTNTNGDLSSYDVRSLAYDSTHNILYAGTIGHGIWRYDGSTWTDINYTVTDTYTVWSLAYDSTLDIIYAGTEANGVWYDYGVSWNLNSPGNAGGGSAAIYSFIYNPDLQVFYAGTASSGAGMEKFNNITWSQMGSDLQGMNVYSLAMDSSHSRLYAGTGANGVWVYNGSSWTKTSGFTSGDLIISLAYYPAGNLVYAGTDTSGVWSYDGAGWTSTGGDIGSFEIQSLACDSTHSLLYAGTTDHGVWSTPISPPPPPASITFPDANLEAAIRAAIGIPSGDIHQSDLDNLTNFSAENLGIVDLTGLEHCTNLQQLDLAYNQIADISALGNLTKLQSLTIDNNQIDNLAALSGDTALQQLNLGWNMLSDISPLANLVNLTELDLYNYYGDNIASLANLTKLQKLTVGNELISSISPLANLTNLTELLISGGKVSDLSPLANLTKLEVFSFHSLHTNPRISDISVLAKLTNLWEIDLQSNLISDLTPLANLPKLKWLFLSDNPISNLTPLAGISTLEDLDAAMAPLSDLSPLSNLTKLRSLSLFNDQIADLTPLANLIKLDGINLSNNKIDDISALVNLPMVRWITLTYNYLNTNAGSQNMLDIQTLTNRGVQVTYIPQNLVVTTASPLPDGQVGIYYSQSLDASGGNSPYTWEIISGNLPPGLTITGNIISGTPTTAGTTNFTVKVTDSTTQTPATATKPLSITITSPSIVTINVTETIGVTDSCQVLPAAIIDLIETIGVNDSCQALPPAVIDLVETIGVSDSIQPLPAVLINIVESITVVDQETVLGSGAVPTTTSISPIGRFKGYSAFSLTVTGTNFTPTSVVRFAGGDRPTTFVSSTQLTASIPPTDLRTAGHFNITVFNPAPGGGESNLQTFTVYSLVFQLNSPGDLYLTDPDGLHVGLDPATNNPVNQIADADYSGPGTEPELVSIMTLKPGDYVMKVIPRAGVSPTDTYTLTVSFDGNTVVLANNVTVGNIPGQGYTIESSASGLSVWNYSFYDDQRHTQLYINTDNGTFQFITPGKVFPIKKATVMRVIDFSKDNRPPVKYNFFSKKWSIDVDKLNLDKDLKLFAAQYQSNKKPNKVILINHKDRELQLSALVVDGEQDSCIAFARDLITKKSYLLIDRGDQSWTYTFYDGQTNTALSLNMPNQLFQLTTPDKQFPIKQAPMIRSIDPSKPNVLIFNPTSKTWKLDTKKLNLENELKPLADQMVFTEKPQKMFLISYHDKELQISAVVAHGTADYCVAYAKDIKTGKEYQLINKP